MMDTVRTLSYDDSSVGRKVLPFPPELAFAAHADELARAFPAGESKDNFLKIGVAEGVFKQSNLLAEYLLTSAEPHAEMLRIAALAFSGEPAGLKLLYAALLASPPAEELVMELVEFRNAKRFMAHVVAKERAGKPLRESEDWFKKKLALVSLSHPLPGASRAASDAPWLGWSDEVRRAVADPDRSWDTAILERAKAELEALDLRIKLLLTRIDFQGKPRSTIFLVTKGEETRWRIQSLEEAYQRFGETTLVLQRRLADKWQPMMEALRGTPAGAALADLLDQQRAKAHAYPHFKTGTAVIRALLMHPMLQRSQRKPDCLSCLAAYCSSAGKGILELLLQRLTGANAAKTLLDLPGFALADRILTIDLAKVPPSSFVDVDDMPLEVDWTSIQQAPVLSWRNLVMTYMDNDNFMVELLNNPRVVGQPGIVPLIAQKSRSGRVLNIIANTRALYSGFSNKEVPINLLMNPAKVPLSAIRKFVHVRFLDKASLARLGGKGSQIREEVRREIQHYLAALK